MESCLNRQFYIHGLKRKMYVLQCKCNYLRFSMVYRQQVGKQKWKHSICSDYYGQKSFRGYRRKSFIRYDAFM